MSGMHGAGHEGLEAVERVTPRWNEAADYMNKGAVGRADAAVAQSVAVCGGLKVELSCDLGSAFPFRQEASDPIPAAVYSVAFVSLI